MKKGFLSKFLAFALSTSMLMGSVGMSTNTVVLAQNKSSNSLRFNFGTTELDGYTKVDKSDLYTKENGYGFSTIEFKDEALGWSNGVYYERKPVITAGDSRYISDSQEYVEVASKVWTETESSGYGVYTYENTSTFDVDLEPADYTVSVELVNPTNGVVNVNLEAEDITKVSGISIEAGMSVTKSYTACLVDGTLNLKFLASSTATTEASAVQSSVYVSKVTIEKQVRVAGEKPTVFIASDSTVQTYDEYYYPQTGWGQVFYNFFTGNENVLEYENKNCNYSQAQTYETSSVIIENRAIGGRSSKSFIEEGKLDDLLEDVKPGDYVLVQWGHNDATASRPNRYVASTEFEKYLQYYIDGVTQRGATCVLVTPVARRSYTEANGVASFKSDFEAYRQVMLKIEKEQNVALLDLTSASIELCNKFGAEGSKALFLWLNAGDYTGAYAGGVSDSTHLQYYGAYKFAQCVANLINEYEKDSQLDNLKTLLDLEPAFETVPSIPTGLEEVTVGATSVSMKWDVVEDAELYYIYRVKLEAGQSQEDISFDGVDKYSVSASTKFTDANCVGGNTYVYAVAGFNELGVGNKSEKLVVTMKSALYKYDFCLDASNPTLEGWTQVTCKQLYNKEVGYGFLKAPGNGRNRANNGNQDSNAMTDDFCLGEGEFAVDLPNGDYEITITACDLLPGTSTIKASYTAEGASIGGISTKQAAATVSAKVRVEDGQLNIGIGGTNPYINGLEITPISLAPTGLLYQELTFEGEQANFLLNWRDVDGAIAYHVYQKGQSDLSYTRIKTITTEEKENETTLPFTAMLGEVYEYYVTAVFADESESAKSNVITIEMYDVNAEYPETPVNLKYATVEDNHIEFTWDESKNAIKYIVYRSDKAEGDKGFTGFQKIGETKENSYTDTTVKPTINWYYKVQSVSSRGAQEVLSEALMTPITSERTMVKAETLADRALVAINLSGDKGVGVDENGKEGTRVSSGDSGVYLSWRLFENDSKDITFTLYKNGEILVKGLTVTNYLDTQGSESDTYKVVGSTDDSLGINSETVATWQNQYIEFQLDKPEDQVMPDGSTCNYTANDMSVADLDGDGKYELIVKWYPSNAQDNSKSGYTGTTILDAYDINYNTGEASKMWRIDLGINIRSGAHYTQFQVWDLDGDGIAEYVKLLMVQLMVLVP